jgi:lipid-A-disaccharide synthase
MNTSAPSVLIIAGEVSGDMHAARLVRAVKERLPEARFFGIGGDDLRSAGVEIRYEVGDMAVMGFSEVVRRFAFFRRVFMDMLRLAEARRPDLAILVDYPGFNLRFAERIHRLGIRTVYYIAPQVWAWNRSRIPKMARVVDRLVAIFPFEPDVFKGTKLPVDFVGHPLVDAAATAWRQPPAALPWKGEPRVAVLPGSREHEIGRMLPVMWGAAGRLAQRHPGVSFLVAAPSAPAERKVRDVLPTLPGGPARWDIVTGNTREVLRQARAAMVASGTATIEAALMRCPMIVVYKVALLTYLLGRLVVRIPRIGMVNIVAGRALCPEFVQGAATPAGALEPLLAETPERAAMVAGLRRVHAALGPGGSDGRAADIIVAELRSGAQGG